ncbi:MAG: HXXEE domain-containing protein [Candidatus Krumholzibacteria bacterium]|nr:HXXEE domain-containing protein [Candidatus Krumholzibacteria bacterium]
MLNVLPSMFVLGLAALAAMLLVLSRWSPAENVAERIAAARALAVAVGVQSVHFAEEAASDFHERLGALLGLPGIPLSVFVVLNLMWLGIWVASVPGLRSARVGAFFAAWFLAIAGMFNGIAHPLLAIAAGGYFPGLVSSPLIGVAGVWLWLRLRSATRPSEGAAGSMRSG